MAKTRLEPTTINYHTDDVPHSVQASARIFPGTSSSSTHMMRYLRILPEYSPPTRQKSTRVPAPQLYPTPELEKQLAEHAKQAKHVEDTNPGEISTQNMPVTLKV